MNYAKINIITSILLISLVSFISPIYAQELNPLKGTELTVSTVDPTLSAVYFSLGEMPEFPGGIDSLKRFAATHIYYPESAVNNNIEGKVFIQFIIDSTGKVVDKKIIRSVRSDLDNVCLAMLDQMPKWKPGKLKGKNVAVIFIWPIKFMLDE